MRFLNPSKDGDSTASLDKGCSRRLSRCSAALGASPEPGAPAGAMGQALNNPEAEPGFPLAARHEEITTACIYTTPLGQTIGLGVLQLKFHKITSQRMVWDNKLLHIIDPGLNFFLPKSSAGCDYPMAKG